MVDPWTYAEESVSLGDAGSLVSLVEGSTFALSGRSGDIVPGFPHGFFHADTRYISQLQLRVNGQVLEPLTVASDEPFAAVFVQRTRPRRNMNEASLLLQRARELVDGMRESIKITNYESIDVTCRLEIAIDADFANVFEVKEDRLEHRGEHSSRIDGPVVRLSHRDGSHERALNVHTTDAVAVTAQLLRWDVSLPARSSWSTVVEFVPGLDPFRRLPSHDDAAEPMQRLQAWRRQVPTLRCDYPPLVQSVSRSQEDLGALRMVDEASGRTVVAAGAPWFMTLFGRDSLLTSWMGLIDDVQLAQDVLETLALYQGTQVNLQTEEQPGRIMHEMRAGSVMMPGYGNKSVYYGTVDATPLFVMLMGELRRWGLASESVDHLMPHADAALAWIKDYGDRDGDGFVEYERLNEHGLVNQGWKDSHDAMRFRDGRIAEGPIALSEVQGYTYSAYLARAHFADEANDIAMAADYRARAAELKRKFNEQFWMEDEQYFALALDGDKNQINSITSNPGHCLWTGIVDEDKAPMVAKRLMSDEMFCGWGVRTASSEMGAYNPLSYHNGSLWPHDNAIVAAGLMRYGFVEEAHRIILGCLDLAAASSFRLPELAGGVDRIEINAPVSYPTSCSPQAWSAASTLLFLRTMLRLDPWIPQGKLWLAPALPPQIRHLRVDNIPLAGHRVSIDVHRDDVQVTGLPSDLEVFREGRAPLSADAT